MLAPVIRKDALSDEGPVRLSAVEERDFYGHYGWCLNPHLTVAEAQAHLGVEAALHRVRHDRPQSLPMMSWRKP